MQPLTELPPRISPQPCPFCGVGQEVLVLGHSPTEGDPDKTHVTISQEKGYSFCNCKNVFYTSWANIEQSVYNPDYLESYKGERIAALLTKYLHYYEPYFEPKRGRRFLELGTVNEAILEEAQRMGFDPTGADFFERESKFKMLAGDFEKIDVPEGHFGVIFASHIFEHFRDPLAMLRKCHSMLETGGRILIAMPDPFFIDWKDPYTWGHWHFKEHHIMWDMDSFAAEMKKVGFKILLKRHNVDSVFICLSDMHIIAEKI